MERLDLARVLVVNDDLATRLTLQTVLEAGGYRVDAADTAAQAVDKLNDDEYELVLSASQVRLSEGEQKETAAATELLAYAQGMNYQPATAIFRSEFNGKVEAGRSSQLIAPEDIPGLLSKIANMIARRVNRRVRDKLALSDN
jgi:CheY-like chemotaxis protein